MNSVSYFHDFSHTDTYFRGLLTVKVWRGMWLLLATGTDVKKQNSVTRSAQTTTELHILRQKRLHKNACDCVDCCGSIAVGAVNRL